MPGMPVGALGKSFTWLLCFAGVTKNLLEDFQEWSIMGPASPVFQWVGKERVMEVQ
jgi:hypothetical protein